MPTWSVMKMVGFRPMDLTSTYACQIFASKKAMTLIAVQQMI